MALMWKAKRAADAGEQTSEEVCSLCNGTGGVAREITDPSIIGMRYETDEWVECQCAGRRRQRQYLRRVWPELADLPEVRVDAGLVEKLGQSCRITAPWQALAPQLRAAVLAVHRHCHAWRVAVYRDNVLGALANADRVARAFDDPTVARLDDAAELIVIRTGFLVKTNKAVPAAICDLISDRAESPSRRIWILDDPRMPLNEKSTAWGDGMAEALGRLDHFEVE